MGLKIGMSQSRSSAGLDQRPSVELSQIPTNMKHGQILSLARLSTGMKRTAFSSKRRNTSTVSRSLKSSPCAAVETAQANNTLRTVTWIGQDQEVGTAVRLGQTINSEQSILVNLLRSAFVSILKLRRAQSRTEHEFTSLQPKSSPCAPTALQKVITGL